MTKLTCLVSIVLFWALAVTAAKPAMREALPSGADRLPIGAFAVPRDLLYLAKMKGFEVVHDYRFEESRDQNDELAAYLDAARDLGLKVLVGLEHQENYTVPKVVERVRRFRNHPAVWAWYLGDEPKPEMNERVAKIAGAIRREDTGHPLVIATDAAPLAALADLVFAYTYPVYDRPFPEQDLGDFVRRLDQAVTAGTSFAVLVQTFNWNHYLHFEKRRRDNRYPCPEEMRFMAFYGVMRGCRGVFFFSFQTLPVESRNLNQSVAPLIRELKGMREYLAGQQIDAKKYSDYQHAAAWGQKGGTLLLVTNPTSKSATASLKAGPWTWSDLRTPEGEIPPGTLTLRPWGVRLLLAREKLIPQEGTAR